MSTCHVREVQERKIIALDATGARCHIGCMDATELQDIRRRLGLTQVQLAKVLGVSIRTMIRQENKGQVSPQIATMVEWLNQGWRPREWPWG